VIASIVESAEDRREVYDAVDIAESTLAKLINHPKPPGKSVLKRFVSCYPLKAEELARAWYEDRCERVRDDVRRLAPDAPLAAPSGGAPSVHAALADRTAAALGDKAADLAVVLELVRKIAPYWSEAGPIAMQGLQAAEGVARAHERAAAARGGEKGKAGGAAG